MDKLFFAIYTEKTKILSHIIACQKSKNDLRSELQSRKLNVINIFSKEEVNEILLDKYKGSLISKKEIAYLKENEEDWNHYK